MADQLFVSDGEPMKFYMLPTQAVDADSPHSKAHLKMLIEKHGGKMMDTWTRECHRLVVPGSNNANAGIRTEVITACIQNGGLVNFDLFYDDPTKTKSVDAVRKTKTRNEWTPAEDKACIEYILAHGDPEHKDGSRVPSATWFQEMETRLGKDKCNHSWESIKERTRKKLKIKLQNTAKTSALISKRSRKKIPGSASSSPRKRQATQKATPSKKQKKSSDDEQAQPEKRHLRRGRTPKKKEATHMPSMGDEEELDEVDLALRMAAQAKSKPQPPPTSKKTSTKKTERVTDEEALEPRVTRARRKVISEPQKSKKTKEGDDNGVEIHANKTGRKAKQDPESNVETAIPPKRNNELETEEPEEKEDSDEDSEDLISENDIEFCDNFEAARQALIFIQMETSCSFEEAHQALYNCSGNPKKALAFLQSPESTQCWARDHDKWVTSSDAKLVKKCETLYGKNLVAERAEWLLT